MTVECKNREANAAQCVCKSEDCERRGLCCQCVAAHRSRGSLPSCLRDLVKKEV